MKWLSLALALSLSTATYAQTAPIPEQTPTAEVKLTNNDKEAFVAAYGKVAVIQEKYSQQLTEKSTPEEINKVTQAAQGEMADVITKQEGIDIPKYNQILVALETDQKLREEIQKKLEGKKM